MRTRRVVAALAIATSTVAVHLGPTAGAIDSSTAPEAVEPWVADYEGVEIDLRDGWDGARACQTDGIVTECWDSEAEMLLAMSAKGIAIAPAPVAAMGPQASAFRRQTACSTFLRLYTGTNYAGAVLAISSRFTFLNLSSFGFNNSVSSYKVSGCPAALYDQSNGIPPQYPGATHEYAWGPSMIWGWDNRISSVYLG